MRRARLKAAEDASTGYYHCLSRVVDRRFILEEVEKEHFVGLMRECEAFCEVAVLTYCVMSNHFHVLVEVPRRPEKLPGVEEMVAKLRQLSGHQDVGAVEQRFQMFREAKDEAGEAEYPVLLFNEGTEERESVSEDGGTVRGALKREEVLEVLRAKGRLGLGAYVRCRVRYFCDGVVLGSREFVEGVFRKNRGWLGEKRKAGARKMRGLAGLELFTVRNLRVEVFG
jgi:REP element-mobilizing transposase RayT